LNIFVAAWAAVLCCSALAQVPLQDPKVQPQAAMKNAAGLKSLGFSESFKSLIVANGKTSETSLSAEVVLRGKNDLSCHFTTEKDELRLVSDGTTHYLYVFGNPTYEKSDTPMSRPQLMTAATGGILRAAGTWVADFLHDTKDLLDAAQDVERKGEEDIDGTACEGYRLAYPGFDVTAWLTRGDPPVLRRAEVDLQKSVNNQGHEAGPVSATVQVNITDWKPNLEVRDSQFVFTPPDGVELAKPEKHEESMEGKEAEDFELPLLDGGTVKLSSLKGKTVVLDFWATWCGPCRMAMPIVDKVTGEFADRGVVLYTVNLQEGAEAVKGFLQAMKLNPKVALDKEGMVARAYGAPPIPSIVLIGTDGVVRKVFRGVSPVFENELRGALSGIAKETAPAK
jgi:thiol-disulfide isomerase/thioredoxin